MILLYNVIIYSVHDCYDTRSSINLNFFWLKKNDNMKFWLMKDVVV